MIYNIGLNKLVIQNTLPNGKQYIHNFPSHETFIDHVQFRKLSDIGFYPGNLSIEASSRFAFLTYDKRKKEYIVNFLAVDPYYGETQFAIFKSTKRVDLDEF